MRVQWQRTQCSGRSVGEVSRPTLCDDTSCGTAIDEHIASWQSSSCGTADHAVSMVSDHSVMTPIDLARARNHCSIATPDCHPPQRRVKATPKRVSIAHGLMPRCGTQLANIAACA